MEVIGFSKNIVCAFCSPVLLWDVTETGNPTVSLLRDSEECYGILKPFLHICFCVFSRFLMLSGKHRLRIFFFLMCCWLCIFAMINFRFQLMHNNFISLIILLYMFRVPMCPSSGGSTIHSQQLVQCHLICRPYSR